MHPIRVRALSNVLGLHRGDEVEVQPTPRVETLIAGGHLLWLDEPGEDPIPVHDEGEMGAEPPKPAKKAAASKTKSDDDE